MNHETTADLLMLLSSRSRRLDYWDRNQRNANWPRSRSEYSDTDDENLAELAAVEIARRIDAVGGSP